VILVVGLSISVLVYCVLVQKQIHTVMMGQNMAQMAKVDIERNITAYFAHELRNPLSAIDSALASMPCSDPEENAELLSSMKLCSSFMTTIMNNLLDVRKLEEGKLVLHSDPFSLQQIIQDVRKMARPTLRPNVDFLIEFNTGEKDCVMGDASRINQILTNIVSNAVKYTLIGSITLAVGWDKDIVQFECRDTGPGIPKEQQSRMFERFVQRGGAPGSGLGLALVKQMVALMSGTIHFDSDPTIRPGTTCVVRLPLKSCDVPVPNLSLTNEQPLNEPLRILLVDDIKMNRVMLKRRLQKDIAPCCEIVEASTGEDALAICEKVTFDVIIMDQYMEEAGGILVGTDVIIALRRMKVSSVIIGCSGNDLSLEFTSSGADIVWSKPMPSNAEMIQQLRQFLQQRVQASLRSSYKDE
jgi:two-component system, sensor histidine kinase